MKISPIPAVITLGAVLGTVALDFVGPWYLPALVHLAVGFSAGIFRLRVWPLALIWPLYAILPPLVVGLTKNPEFILSVSRLFSMPHPAVLWVVPLVIFGILNFVALKAGEALFNTLWIPRGSR
jgi:hypothetical protein